MPGSTAPQRPVAIAHRGGAGDGLENSLAAFARAVELGYRHLETDVQCTADGVLVAFHDPTLDRLTDRRGAIAELPWSDVRRARIGGREPIPRFDDLLAQFPACRFVVDPKADAAVAPLVAALRAADAVERVCVGSFSQARLGAIRRALPGVLTSAGPREVGLLRLAGWRLLPPLAGPRAPGVVQVPETYRGLRIVDRGFVRAAHRQRLGVQVWTVNEPADMHRLLDLGVDGLITDNIVALREVLRSRGVWREPEG